MTPKPTRVEGKWIDVSVGYENTCAIKSPGYVFCWGNMTENRLGMFGAAFSNENIPDGTLPIQLVHPDENFSNVAVGDGFACAMTADSGQIYCWGESGVGQALLASGGSSNDPQKWTHLAQVYLDFDKEESSPTPRWKSFKVAKNHACAMDVDDRIFCWGSGAYQKKGRFTPGITDHIPVLMNIDEAPAFIDYSLGPDHTCVTSVHGGAQNRQSTRCSGKTSVLNPGGSYSQPDPGVLYGTYYGEDLTIWKGMTSSGLQICALNPIGEIGCFGTNKYELIGEPTFTASLDPFIFKTNATYKKIAFHSDHACAITSTDGAIHCWGRNDRGQVGINTPQGSYPVGKPTPVDLSGLGSGS